MNVRTFVLALALVLLTPGALAGPTGPYHGFVRQGETDVHFYDNAPDNPDQICPQIGVFYTATLTYAPPSDTLTLTVDGESVTGSNGSATLTFVEGVCAEFDVRVTGTQVGDRARYTVTISP